MKESLKLLMIDDSRTIRDSYEIVVHRLQETFTVEHAIVGTADEALNRINFAAQSPYHIVCVDIELLHPSRDPSIISGEDLALRIKELQPKTKIIVITNHEKKERIRYIYNTLQPESLLIKLQAGFDDICRAITEVKNGYTFYSPLAEKIIRDIEKYKTEQQDILDTVDKHIIFYLNKHFTHAEISRKIGKSESTIEKRKRKMKSIFGLEEDSDANLLSHAKNIGFLDGFRE